MWIAASWQVKPSRRGEEAEEAEEAEKEDLIESKCYAVLDKLSGTDTSAWLNLIGTIHSDLLKAVDTRKGLIDAALNLVSRFPSLKSSENNRHNNPI